MTWRTGLTEIEPGAIRVRGYAQEELMGTVPFSDVVFLLFTGELPSPPESRLFSAVLTACVDHSVTPPSAHATRLTTSGGATLPSAVASGLIAIGDYHGGAMLELQKLLESIVEGADSETEIDERARETVRTYREAGDRVPGLGHRYHTVDPRAERIVSLLEEEGRDGQYLVALTAIRRHLAADGIELNPNVDGAIAVVLGELGIDHELAQAVFVVGRAAGLAAHAYEERTRETPMRKMGPRLDKVEYDGPPKRELPNDRSYEFT
jgi:citrate synthase